MKKRLIALVVIAAALVIADQATKYLVRQYIHPLETIELLPFFNLVNVRNTGAAFGMFRALGNTFFISVSAVAILFMSAVAVSGKEDYRIFSVLAGGAAGNLIDRVSLGYVVDFLDFHLGGFHWPSFNVADSCLTIGITLLFIKTLTQRN